ncbi:MAG: carbohydrate-binding domain-containing protein [Lachnospiraceae bacterium]|nr:carbohydrate-binding domain-containing protein [Lachnospiraceae bacterium]
MKKKNIQILLATMITAAMLTACGQQGATGGASLAGVSALAETESQDGTSEDENGGQSENRTEDKNSGHIGNSDDTGKNESSAVTTSYDSGIDPDDVFTDRDLEQSPDLSDAATLVLTDGEDINISSEGIYVISGSAKDATIFVDAADDDKVQIVLDHAAIINRSAPCIYVKNADKVFVTTTGGESSLTVTQAFENDGDTGADAVIFSKDDLVINGMGSLQISSSENGVRSQDDLKITGSTITISAAGSALKAHDMIAVADGTVQITQCNDGLHAEYDEDDSKGCIFIASGKMTINAADDAIHATTVVRIDGGQLNLTGKEGLEGTYIQINDGTIDISASDDGINATAKSSAYTPRYEQNGGTVKVTMGAGDTDGVDSNGDIIINGGTIDITGQSTFDYDGTATYNGGTIIENGKQTDTITNQDIGGHGGMGHGRGFMGQDGNTGNGDGFTGPDGNIGNGEDSAGTDGNTGNNQGFVGPDGNVGNNQGFMGPDGVRPERPGMKGRGRNKGPAGGTTEDSGLDWPPSETQQQDVGNSI